MYGKWQKENIEDLTPEDITPDARIKQIEETTRDLNSEEYKTGREEIKPNEPENSDEDNNDDETEKTNQRLIREMARLGGTSFNQEANKIKEMAEKGITEEEIQDEKLNSVFDVEENVSNEFVFLTKEGTLTEELTIQTNANMKVPEDIDDAELIRYYFERKNSTASNS